MPPPEQPADPVGHLVPIHGEAPFRALVAAFYRRIPSDPILGPMYPEDDLAGAEQRLADFLVQRLGGEPEYSRRRGHPRLRMRHAPFPVDRAARDRWMLLMRHALAETDLPADAKHDLDAFLGDVATFLINR